ncbi:MAG: hypothetical protein M5U28_05780 [Sandaracinaceae bacterium]|nr:hypothetical protein [Sandaracinaceae bacterium]
MIDGISVFGGYSSARGWARSSAYDASVTNDLVVDQRVIGVSGIGIVSPTVWDRVNVATQTPRVAFPGVSNYGFYCSGCTALTIKNSEVRSGAGTAGARGRVGTAGDDGGPGGRGYDGSDDGNGSGAAGGTAGLSPASCSSGGSGGSGGDSGDNAGMDGGDGSFAGAEAGLGGAEAPHRPHV